MPQIATITAQRQFTIPASYFDRKFFRPGDKVIVETLDDGIKITPAISLVKKLAGSINVPSNLANGDLDEIISIAKRRYFSKKK